MRPEPASPPASGIRRAPHHDSICRLLDREVSEDYLREWSVHVAAVQKVAQAGTKSVVIFRAGAEWLALPTDMVQEVSEPCKIRTLPHQRGGILLGLVSVRGVLLLCVSLEALLGAQKASEHKTLQRLLVCNPPGGRLALPVSEVHSVHHYHPEDLRPPPATLAKAAGIYITGVLPWRDKTVGCLDGGLLFYALDKGLE